MAARKKQHEAKAEKPVVEGIEREYVPEDEQAQEQGQSQVDKSFSHRSKRSAERGGQNREMGEPTPGYGTEAPQVQGGGKR